MYHQNLTPEVYVPDMITFLVLHIDTVMANFFLCL